MQDMTKIKIVIKDRNLIQKANDYIKTNIKQFENINAYFAYCIEDDIFIVDLNIGYNDYTNKHYIMFSQFKGGLFSYGKAFQGHLPLLMQSSPIIEI